MNPNTQRSIKFREELKKDPEKLEAYRKKDRERKKKKYHEKMAKLSKHEKEKLKEKEWLRKRKERKCKKNDKAKRSKMSSGQDRFSISPDVFLSPQSLGKTVHRVKSSLPKSPTKVPVVITKVIEDLSPRKRRAVIEACDISYKRKKFESNERKKRLDALTQEEADKVEAFFMRDDISRMCPGKKDFVSVKTPSGRVQKQKRLLLLNVHEAYEVFKKESDIKIGKSKFASLRSIQVTPLTSRD